MKLIGNLKFYIKSKYISIKYYFIRDLIKDNKLRLIYIPTKEQLANPLTKGVNKVKLEI